jgi:hypothetical protein
VEIRFFILQSQSLSFYFRTLLIDTTSKSQDSSSPLGHSGIINCRFWSIGLVLHKIKLQKMEHSIINDRLTLVAPCGIDCGICELHLVKPEDELYQSLVLRGIPEEKLPCPGCRAVEGNCPVKPTVCDTWKCIKENELEFCSGCTDFPCNKLQPAADRANVLPHNLKVFNLCKINQVGLIAFTQESAEIKKKYYLGKIVLGNGPHCE